jgi:hypothetical protein
MALFVFLSLVHLGVLVFVLRWAFGQPHGAVDAVVRVIAATVAGAMLAAWIVGATLLPRLNEEAKQDGNTLGAPSITDARAIANDVVETAPVSMDLAAAVGAGVGFFVALASIGSFRRVA